MDVQKEVTKAKRLVEEWRSGQEAKAKLDNTIRRLCDAGLSKARVARELGFSRGYISQIVNR